MNDGFLIINKPLGLSSRQLLDKIKPFTDKKIGHTGTLDPLATGMMVISIGDATKFSQWIVSQDKAYEAVIQLGTQTTTDDQEGEIIASSAIIPSLDLIQSVLTSFQGDIEQEPPQFSAIHVNGKRAYKMARKNQTVVLKKRPIYIHKINIIDYNPHNRQLTLYIHCQSGTYIRSIARDLGIALQCYGHLFSLNRRWVSPFEKQPMISLEELPAKTISLDEYFKDTPHINLEYDQALRLAQGLPIHIHDTKNLAVYHQETFIGMIHRDKDVYRSTRLRSNILKHISLSDHQ